MEQKIVEFINKIFENKNFVSATLSAPKSKEECSKLTIRPLLIKETLQFQVTEFKGAQVFHQNLTSKESIELLLRRLKGFGQSIFTCTDAVYHLLISKKLKMTLIKKMTTTDPLPLLHNRKKEYLLQEGIPLPFLLNLGIMNVEGKVYPAKRDKFRQINRFLEMVDDILSELDCKRPLQIVDFGCGKAYLTFAIYHYLKKIKGLKIRVIGIDRKAEVLDKCRAWVEELGDAADFTFIKGDIQTCTVEGEIDLAVSLHACDVATDFAMAKAIELKAKALLFAPCCQHELFKQIDNKTLTPLLKHGILKERIAVLATDAARGQLLEIAGYQTQMIEFIDPEHTPKNLLIRAVYKGISGEKEQVLRREYATFCKELNIRPTLESLLETKAYTEKQLKF